MPNRTNSVLVRCVYSGLVGGVDRLSFRLSCFLRPSAQVLSRLGFLPGAGELPRRLGFSCICAARVTVAPAVGAVPLCLVPRWHKGRCYVSVVCFGSMPVQRPGWGIAVYGSCSVVGLCWWAGGLALVMCAFGDFLPYSLLADAFLTIATLCNTYSTAKTHAQSHNKPITKTASCIPAAKQAHNGGNWSHGYGGAGNPGIRWLGTELTGVLESGLTASARGCRQQRDPIPRLCTECTAPCPLT